MALKRDSIRTGNLLFSAAGNLEPDTLGLGYLSIHSVMAIGLPQVGEVGNTFDPVTKRRPKEDAYLPI